MRYPIVRFMRIQEQHRLLVGMLLLIIILFVSPLLDTAIAQQLAFPTAEGWGRFTTGGRGDGSTGYVCHVDTLSGTSTGSQIGAGPHHRGSFRYCVGRSGARTIVFDRSGTIDNLASELTITNTNLTIAGQTSPGDGVQFTRSDTNIRTSNAIVRYVRFRPGIDNGTPGIAEALSIQNANNVIFDHVSLSWATDETSEIVNSTNSTVQWSIISEGLIWSGQQAYGLLSTSSNQYSLHHNLFAHNKDRNPILGDGDLQYVNNVVYNFNRGIVIYPNFSGAIEANIVGNYFKPGATGSNSSMVALGDKYIHSGISSVYVEGNIHPVVRPNNTLNESLIVTRFTASNPVNNNTVSIVGSPFSYPSINTDTAFEAFTRVKQNSGAIKPVRDSVDNRIVLNVENGTGNVISDPNTVGGLPDIDEVSRDVSFDTDADGIPDEWETLCNGELGTLSPSNKDDGNDIITGINADVNGYSKLEVYLNELAGDYDSVGGVNTCGGSIIVGETDPPSTPTMDSPVIQSHTQIDLSWSAATDASGISGYSILWCEDDGSETCTPLNSISLGNVTSYSHENLVPDTTYGYQVKAIDAASPTNEGAYSSPVIYGTTDTAPGADITTGLVSHWTFNSVLTDAGSSGANATGVGSPGYVTGQVSNAIDLNGSNQYVTVADNDSHDFGTSTNFAYALWVQADASSKQFVLSKVQSQGGSSDGGWSIELVSGTGKILTGITSDAWNNYCAVSSTANVSDESWHHIAVNIIRGASCTLSSIELYIDGVLDTSRTLTLSNANTNANISNNDPLWIGAEHVSGSPTSFLNGRVDDVRVYNRLLDVIDIQALFALASADTESPTVPTNLIVNSFSEEDLVVQTSLTWDISIDNVGPVTYRIQRCEGVSCSNFSDLDTSLSNSYIDESVLENTWYSYKVRAEDLVPNVSDYSDVEAILTLDVARVPLPPSGLVISGDSTVAVPSIVTGVSIAAASTPTQPSPVTGLSVSAASTVTFPPVVTGVE